MALCRPLWAVGRQHHLTPDRHSSQDLGRLETIIGHVFTDRDLLIRALTHSSAGTSSKSYERLEFLGDRVLGLVLASYFFENCPDDDEGNLSLRLHAAARQSTLVGIANRLDLAPFIHVQSGFDVTDHDSVLADVVEAVIAALYLDGGYAAARRFVLDNWPFDLGAITAREKDAKSRLQEYVLKRGMALPRYTLVEKTGPDHAPEMVYQVELDDGSSITAAGTSRKIAEQGAAEAMLALLNAD